MNSKAYSGFGFLMLALASLVASFQAGVFVNWRTSTEGFFFGCVFTTFLLSGLAFTYSLKSED